MPTNENAQSSSANLPSSAKENLEVLSQFKDREEAQISGLQLAIERTSRVFGSPAFFAFALAIHRDLGRREPLGHEARLAPCR